MGVAPHQEAGGARAELGDQHLLVVELLDLEIPSGARRNVYASQHGEAAQPVPGVERLESAAGDVEAVLSGGEVGIEYEIALCARVAEALDQPEAVGVEELVAVVGFDEDGAVGEEVHGKNPQLLLVLQLAF